MVNLSECMDPKRYIGRCFLQWSFWTPGSVRPVASQNAKCSPGGAIHMNNECYCFLCCLIHNLSLLVGINIDDGYSEGHSLPVCLDILNFVLASSSDSKTYVYICTIF